MKKIVLASNNKGKLAEFQQLFQTLGIELINQGALGVGECEEPYFTFLENALTKARFASKATGLPAIADDSGLVVPALGGGLRVYYQHVMHRPKGVKSRITPIMRIF